MSISLGTTPMSGNDIARFNRRSIMGTLYETTGRYQLLEPIGMSISGLVCSAIDQIGHQYVAIKKICEPFKTNDIAKHMYREIKLLKQLQHDNINHLNDVFISPSREIYLVTDLMMTDLHTLLKTKKVDNQFIQYFLYQIMRGLKYVHSAGVVHRDLKPSNILINENCDLKISGFGLARVQESQMTGYVSTRYYRAPEIMLMWRRYDEKIDIWSAGCIFAEMMTGRPLFPGENHIDQFCVITQVLGNPPDHILANVKSQKVGDLTMSFSNKYYIDFSSHWTLDFIRTLPERLPKSLATIISTASREAINLLNKLLQLDPQNRCSAVDALESQYLSPYHDPEDEPEAPNSFDWSFLEADLCTDVWKTIIYTEVLDYHQQSDEPFQLAASFDGMDLG